MNMNKKDIYERINEIVDKKKKHKYGNSDIKYNRPLIKNINKYLYKYEKKRVIENWYNKIQKITKKDNYEEMEFLETTLKNEYQIRGVFLYYQWEKVEDFEQAIFIKNNREKVHELFYNEYRTSDFDENHNAKTVEYSKRYIWNQLQESFKKKYEEIKFEEARRFKEHYYIVIKIVEKTSDTITIALTDDFWCGINNVEWKEKNLKIGSLYSELMDTVRKYKRDNEVKVFFFIDNKYIRITKILVGYISWKYTGINNDYKYEFYLIK